MIASISRTVFAAITLLTAVCAASTAASQTYTRPLPDGRTVTLPTTLAGCEKTTEEDSPAVSLQIRFTCAAATASHVDIVVISVETRFTPMTLLETQAQTWWPDFASWPAEQKATFFRRQTKTLAGGGTATFHCIYRDNIDALNGDAACVLDTPQAQMLVEAQSTMASTADDLIDAILARTVLR